MISLGSRLPVTLAVALAIGLVACTGDDGDGRTDATTMVGDDDGDGDDLEGDGDGDGDHDDGELEGDGDGDESPETGDGDGDGEAESGDGGGEAEGDGDPTPGECPSGDTITVAATFYTDLTTHPETVFETCATNMAQDWGEAIHFVFYMVDVNVRLDIAKDVEIGVHNVSQDESGLPFASVTVNDYITDAWLGTYSSPGGVVEIIDKTDGGVAGVANITVVKGDHHIDAVIEFSAKLP